MNLMDDAKDKVDEAANDVENKFHEMKGQAEGYQQGQADANEMCNCGKDGCTCAAGACTC